jgi:NAD(P)-dependent dehydrogenase (short-subunit alcohol dehydrogenase family)
MLHQNEAGGQSSTDPKQRGARPPFPQEEQEGPGHEGSMSPAPDYGEDSYVGHGRLEGKVALITGADSGIGRAVALAFAREGADVVVAYYNEHDDAKETQHVVEASGKRALLVAADLAEEEERKRLIDEAIKRFGRLDVLVNNAAAQGKAVQRMEEISLERIEHTFKVNIIAMFSLVRHALPYMKPGSNIINVGSIQAYDPSPGILDYASTKGAITAFTKGLAQELIKRGIRANVVAPGPVWTPLIVQSFHDDKIQHFGENSPMGRPAQPVELAPAFVFLASEEARYVNGEVLGVTGGGLLA